MGGGLAKVFEAGAPQFLGEARVLLVELANPRGLSGADACQVDKCWRAGRNGGYQAAKSIGSN